jgi:hypothetical protein
MGHLLIALYRAAGLPARYWHLNAKDGVFGHTDVEVYVNGKWYNADATNNANQFGYVVWTLVKDLGRFAELPY